MYQAPKKKSVLNQQCPEVVEGLESGLGPNLEYGKMLESVGGWAPKRDDSQSWQCVNLIDLGEKMFGGRVAANLTVMAGQGRYGRR